MDQKLDSAFWHSVAEYKSYVVGASGVLELRLFDKPPCTLCWDKPNLLVGVSIPFEIIGKNKKLKNKKKNRKKRVDL